MQLHADRRNTALLAEAAMVVALSVALGNLRLLELPAGGSISFGSLPLLAFAAVRGLRVGVLAAACAGLGHALAGGTIIHPAQFVLDYGVAYAALGLPGIARPATRARLAVTILLAQTIQLASFVVSGIVFFAPSGDAMHAALVYALGYNAVTVLPETALALWLVPTLARAWRRAHPDLPAHGAAVAVHAPPAPPPLRRPQPRVPAHPHPTSQRRTSAPPARWPARSTGFARPPLFVRPASSGTSPSAWRTTQPRRDFAR